MMRRLSFVFAVCALACASALPAMAQWRPTGVAVATALQDQSAAVTAPDGTGGMYVVWQDDRNGTPSNGLHDIYAQHILASGVADPAWTAGGIAVCALGEAQTKPAILADGTHGAFVAWLDRRGVSHNVAYMARLTPVGVDPAWPANGVALTDTAGVIDWEVQLVRDGGSGVFALSAMFQGYRELRVQHVSSTGVLDPNFTAAGTRAGIIDYWGSRSESMTTDGAGGVICAWKTGGAITYAMRVLASGVTDPAWPAGGRIVQTSGSAAQYPSVVADGAGGGVVVWGQYNGADMDIYAQHVLGNGTLDATWPSTGLVVCDAVGNQQTARIASDGAGGAFVAWSDTRAAGDFDVYAQHVRGSGSVDPAWPANGVALGTQPGTQFAMATLADGAGGAFVLWDDTGSNRRGLYAKRVTSGGQLGTGWPAGGALVSGFEYSVLAAAASGDGTGNVFVAWPEYRLGNLNPRALDVYARRFSRAGTHRVTLNQNGGTAAYVLVPDSLNVFWSAQSALAAIDMTPEDELEFRFPSYPNQSLVSVTADGHPREVAPNHVFRNVVLDIALDAQWSYDPWTVTTQLSGGATYAALGWPMTFATDSVSTLLDELWPTDDRTWRLAHWNPVSAAYDYAGGALTHIQPGQGYWLATRAAKSVAVPGRPLYLPTTNVPLLGDAASGWNQIANPYRFPIADTALRVVAGASVVAFTSAANTFTDTTLWEWTGGSSYTPTHTLLPNRAYWVRKSVAGSVSLQCPNLTSMGRGATPPVRPEDAAWALALSLSQGDVHASPAQIGAWRFAARTSPLHREAPPASPEGGLRLRVGAADAAHANAETEFVSAEHAAAWQLAIDGAEAPGEIALEIAAFDLPAGVSLMLRDPALGWSRDVRPGERITLAATPDVRRLVLEARAGGPAPAGRTSLRMLSAWPNPFRGALGLTAQLSLAGDLRVDILDVQGRLVRTLERHASPAGESVLAWDGRGADGAVVRPGVYLARYRAGAAAGTLRLVKLD